MTSFPSPNDVIRPLPLRPTSKIIACRDVASDAKKTFGVVFCTECTGQGNDFELISTIKMETRHSVEGSLRNKFSSIYNHCGVMAA